MKCHSQSSQAPGFTLIEILVVLVIISITFSFTLVHFGDFGSQRRAIAAAEQCSSYIKLVQQQVILSGSPLKIKLNVSGYQTFHLNKKNQWQSMTTPSIFRPRFFPKGLILNPPTTEIMINAEGELTEFQIKFGTNHKPDLVTLTGFSNGEIKTQ